MHKQQQGESTPLSRDGLGNIIAAHGWPITYQGISYKCAPLSRFGVYGFSTDYACAKEISRLVRSGKVAPLTAQQETK